MADPEPLLGPGVGLSVEVLPAGNGDCLLVRTPTDGGSWRMLVDTGPDEASLGALRARLERIPLVDGRRRIDVVVLTHIDHDHIGNAAELLADEELALDLGDVWFNGLEQVAPYGDDRSRREADEVSAVVDEHGLPLNVAFDGGAVVVPLPKSQSWRAVPLSGDAPDITLLSPRPVELRRLAKAWPAAVIALHDGRPDPDDLLRGRPRDRPPIDVDALAATRFEPDDRAPNRSSIVLLVESRGTSILLAADGDPRVYQGALRELFLKRGPGRNRLDAVKLAHHGSRRNTTTDLAAFRARHYLVSSDNSVHVLPDDETPARLVAAARAGAEPTFWFNYPTPLNLRWAKVAQTRGGFSVRYPADGEAGITLDLPSDA